MQCGCTHMNESCREYEWVTGHIWMRHVTHMNEVTVVLMRCECVWMTESWHIYEWVMAHMWMRHVTNACGWLRESIEYAWLDMAHSYATWLIHPHSHRDELSIQSCILNPHSHAYSIRIDTIEGYYWVKLLSIEYAWLWVLNSIDNTVSPHSHAYSVLTVMHTQSSQSCILNTYRYYRGILLSKTIEYRVCKSVSNTSTQ